MAKQAKKEYSELKKRAMLAKQRLKMGYWQAMTEERSRALDELGTSPLSVQLIKDLQQAKVQRDVTRALNAGQAEKEEQFYCRVCDILERDENVTNPIGQLMDREEYERLDEANKQRYILELSKKFREMRERFYRERMGKSC